MKITVLNGSPRKVNTSAMIDAFVEGAEAAGHTVEVCHVGRMKIAGCLGCEYCHGKGEGECIQKDDWQKLQPSYEDCDMVVFASPIYYFGMTAQMMSAIQRIYCIDHPPKATKAALLLSSASPGTHEGAIGTYKGYLAYTGMEDAGMVIAVGDENQTEEKLEEVRALAKSL